MLNYRHLYYFWIVVKEGGFARAAERLNMAVQTVSAQVRELEKMLGCQLLKPSGRNVAMTDAGEVAFTNAEEIFRIGESVVEAVREAAHGKVVRLTVGVCDSISKLSVQALLKPVLRTPSLRLLCYEGEFEQLLAELALHRLDLVLAGQSVSSSPSMRLTSEHLMDSAIDWYGPSTLVHAVEIADFPRSLGTLPVLLPTRHSALRLTLERWFEFNGVCPRIIGEFEDSALLIAFSARGMGVFPVSRFGGEDMEPMLGLRLLGRCEDVKESIHAIHSRRGQHHPLTMQIVAAARVEASLSVSLQGLSQ